MSKNRIGSRVKVVSPPFPEELNLLLAHQGAAEEAHDRAADAVVRWKLEKVKELMAGRFADIDLDDIEVSGVHECPDTTNLSRFCAYAAGDEWCLFCGDPDERK